MMATTHAFIAGAVAAIITALFPGFGQAFGTVAFLGAAAGGVFPDLDLLFQHRKTFHYPVYYPALLVLTAIAAVFAPSSSMVFAAFFLLGASLHALGDMFGGGLEERPWELTDDRGVYLHITDTWLPTRHWIRYDGSPEDFLLLVACSIPVFVVYDGWVQTVTVISVLASLVYTVLRKKLVEWAPERLL